MAVCGRHLKRALLSLPSNRGINASSELDAALALIQAHHVQRPPANLLRLSKYFKTREEQRELINVRIAAGTSSRLDANGDGILSMEDLLVKLRLRPKRRARVGAQNGSVESSENVNLSSEQSVHQAALEDLNTLAEAAGFERLPRNHWEVSDLGDGQVKPPREDAPVSVWVRGRRPCPLRAAREAALRNRLASVSALFAKIGVKPVAVRASSLELADTAATHGLWSVPTRYLRGRLERKLAAAHQRAATRVRNLPNAVGAAVARLWGMPLRILQQALPPALLGSLAGLSPTSTSSKVDSSTTTAPSQSDASHSSEANSSSQSNNSIEPVPNTSEEHHVDDEARSLAAWREEFEYVLVARRGDDSGELDDLQLFHQVPRHRLALVLPLHKLKLAASEEFMLGSLVVAGAIMPTYRSLHFALEQPWVANAVLLSLAGSVGWYTYSSRAVKRTYLKLRIAEETAQRRVANGGYATSSVLSNLATEAKHHSALVAWAALREKADVDRRATARANAAGGAGWDASLWVSSAEVEEDKEDSARSEDHHSRPMTPAGNRDINSSHYLELWNNTGANARENEDDNDESQVLSEDTRNATEVDGAVACWLAAALAHVQGNATTSANPALEPGSSAAALRHMCASSHFSGLEALGLATNVSRELVSEADADYAGRGVVLGYRSRVVPPQVE